MYKAAENYFIGNPPEVCEPSETVYELVSSSSCDDDACADNEEPKFQTKQRVGLNDYKEAAPESPPVRLVRIIPGNNRPANPQRNTNPIRDDLMLNAPSAPLPAAVCR